MNIKPLLNDKGPEIKDITYIDLYSPFVIPSNDKMVIVHTINKLHFNLVMGI